jgi:protein-S-isoprenylcysteine O-methyltransferase Ste14
MDEVISTLWAAFFGSWALAGRQGRPAEYSEASGTFLARVALFGLAFALVMSDYCRIGLLGERFLPDDAAVAWGGVVLLAAGLGFAGWARWHLGQYWNTRIAIQEDHQLVRTGPYALVRHPIYTGIILGMLGTATAVGERRGLLAVLLLLGIYLWKIPREESWLLRQLGAQYAQYRREVKAVIPFVF